MTEEQHQDDSLSQTLNALRDSFAEHDPQPNWGAQLATAGFLAAIIGIVAWLGQLSPAQPSVVIAQPAIDVTELTEGEAWLGTALQQGLQAYLLSSERVRLVAHAAEASYNLPAVDWVLSAQLLPSPVRSDQLSLTFELTDPETGAMRQTTLTGTSAMLNELAMRTAQQTQRWLGLDALSQEQIAAARAELPTNEQAKQWFAEGLAHLARNDGRAALERLNRAAVRAPDNALIYDAQAEAWSMLGYQDQASAQAQIAGTLVRGLSRERQLAIEARGYLINGDWQRAQDKYRALWEFFPNDVGYGLALANAQQHSADYEPALHTVAALRALPSPYRDDPRIDLSEGQIHYHQGDWQAGRSVLRRAIRKARDAGTSAILAQALQLAAMVDADGADSHLEEAGRLFEALGNVAGQANVLNATGRRAFAAGRLTASKGFYQQAADLAQSVGDETAHATALNNLAINHDLFGELRTGLKLKQEVLASYQRRGVKRGVGVMQENIGISLFKLGHLAQSLASFDQAIEQFYAVRDKIGLAWAPYHRGRIQARLGNLGAARALIEQAVQNAKERPEGHLQVHARFELAQIDLFGANLDRAEQTARSVLSRYQQSNLVLDAAETQLLLARILRSMDKTDEPVQLVRGALTVFRTQQAGYYELNAVTERIDQLSSAPQPTEELIRHCDRLTQLVNGQEHGRARLRGQIRQGLCRHKQGAALTDVAQSLKAVQAEAQQLGLFEPAQEAAELLSVIARRSDGLASSTLENLKEQRHKAGWHLTAQWSL